MATDYYPKLEPGKFYHIFNQGNDRINIFYKPGNYEYFLRRFENYFDDYLDVYCFCLMPNHFHFLARVKLYDIIAKHIEKTKWAAEVNEGNFPEFLSEMFRRFFMAYSKAINKQQNRTGSLFRKNFKRIHVDSLKYLKQLAYYIHRNPEHHGLTDDFRMYPWSSYDRILADKISNLRQQDVIGWFGDSAGYSNYHNEKQEIEHQLIIE